MLEFLLGILFGLVIVPIILIGLLCTFPLTVQRDKNKYFPPKSIPSHHIHLYKLLPSSFIHPHSSTRSFDTLPSLSLHEQNIETILQDLASRAPRGESTDWLNVFILFGYITMKQILCQADSQLLQQLQSNSHLGKTIPKTGTHDTTTKFNQHPLSNPTSPGSTTLLPIINRILLDIIQDIPFVGPVRITYLDFRSIFPQLHRIQIIQYNPETNTLIFDIEFSFTTDSTIEVDLSVNIQHTDLLIASMPAQAALANIYAQINARIAIDLDLTTYSSTTSSKNPNPQQSSTSTTFTDIHYEGKYDQTSDQLDLAVSLQQAQSSKQIQQPCPSAPSDTTINTPSISITLLEPPILRFDLASSIGHSAVFSNLPYVHALIHKAIMVGISSTLVQPNIQSLPLPTDSFTAISQLLVDLATGKKKL